MAKVVSYLLAVNSQNVAAGNGGVIQQLIGPLIVLRPKYIPSEYSFSIALGINDLDKKTDNRLRISITSPSGRQVLDTGYVDLPDLPVDSPLPVKYQGFSLTLPIQNATLDQEGLYKMTVHINEDENIIFENEIPVFVQEERDELRNNNNI